MSYPAAQGAGLVGLSPKKMYVRSQGAWRRVRAEFEVLRRDYGGYGGYGWPDGFPVPPSGVMSDHFEVPGIYCNRWVSHVPPTTRIAGWLVTRNWLDALEVGVDGARYPAVPK